MIRRRQSARKDKKAHPVVGFLLFLISLILLVVTGPLGFIYGLVHSLIRHGLRGVGEYLLKIAVSIDQLGNVMMQHLLNALWIKKDGYKFGNRDETISSALGRNKRLGTLTAFGKLIDRILDMIDPNHSLNSIDYYVEPSSDIEDELAWICLQDRKLLCLRDRVHVYRIPGANRNPPDSDGEALYKSVKDLLGIELDIPSLRLEEVFQITVEDPGKIRRKKCYRSNFSGMLGGDRAPEISWLGYADKDTVSPLDRLIFDYLQQRGELT